MTILISILRAVQSARPPVYSIEFTERQQTNVVAVSIPIYWRHRLVTFVVLRYKCR